jgi:hypothetical protein
LLLHVPYSYTCFYLSDQYKQRVEETEQRLERLQEKKKEFEVLPTKLQEGLACFVIRKTQGKVKLLTLAFMTAYTKVLPRQQCKIKSSTDAKTKMPT